MNTIKRYVLYGLLIFLLIKLPSIIFHANVCINCIGEEPSFQLHWGEPGRRFFEARCYKDDFENLKSLNYYRKSVQDTVYNINTIAFLSNTRNFPNYVGADEQDWDYIHNRATIIHFILSSNRHAINDVVIGSGLDLKSFFREYSIKKVETSKKVS